MSLFSFSSEENVKMIWEDADLTEEHRRIASIVKSHTSNKEKKNLFHDLTVRLAAGERLSLLEEIAHLSKAERSCLVVVDNKTSYTIESSSIAIFGVPRRSGVTEILPNIKYGFRFKKSRFSLKGCAGIQTIVVRKSNTSKLCFLVAFRNYTIQLKNSRNKVAFLYMKDCITEADVQFFEKIMRNVEPNPDVLGCYPSGKYDCTFKATIASEQPAFSMEFNNILIDISMTQDFAAEVKVIISTKVAIEEMTRETKKSLEETSSESSSEEVMKMPNEPSLEENESSEDTKKKLRRCYIM